MAEASENQDSRYRVAYDLMRKIASNEDGDKLEKPDPRTYYLTLYHQCLLASNPRNSLEGILKISKPS